MRPLPVVLFLACSSIQTILGTSSPGRLFPGTHSLRHIFSSPGTEDDGASFLAAAGEQDTPPPSEDENHDHVLSQWLEALKKTAVHGRMPTYDVPAFLEQFNNEPANDADFVLQMLKMVGVGPGSIRYASRTLVEDREFLVRLAREENHVFAGALVEYFPFLKPRIENDAELLLVALTAWAADPRSRCAPTDAREAALVGLASEALRSDPNFARKVVSLNGDWLGLFSTAIKSKKTVGLVAVRQAGCNAERWFLGGLKEDEDIKAACRKHDAQKEAEAANEKPSDPCVDVVGAESRLCEFGMVGFFFDSVGP